MRVVVTGASGNGRAVVRDLLEHDHQALDADIGAEHFVIAAADTVMNPPATS
jgi:NAD(P)-dependent dehydrogenase (short-subunit alcohol dehydrogenase family)